MADAKIRLTRVDLDRLTTRRRDTLSRLRRVTASLAWFHQDVSPEARFLVGYEAERLLDATLDLAEDLTRLLHGSRGEYGGADFDALLEKANTVAEALTGRARASKRRRVIAKLADTRGRTPEEAAVYEAKASAMLVASDREE